MIKHVNVAIKSYRRKTTEGVSPWMMLIWALSGAFLGNYNIGLGVAIPLWVQPQLFAFIAYVCLVQEVHYCKGWSTLKTWLALIALCICTGAFEVALLFAFWVSYLATVERNALANQEYPWVRLLCDRLPSVTTCKVQLPFSASCLLSRSSSDSCHSTSKYFACYLLKRLDRILVCQYDNCAFR